MSESTDDGPDARASEGIAPGECEASRILARCGWTLGELKMTMLLSRAEQMKRHVTGQCSHDVDTAPVPEEEIAS